MKKYQLLATMFCLSLLTVSRAQTGRYLSEVFTSVNTTTNVTYGYNVSVLTGTPTMIPLMMDVYEPAGDVLTARPLVIVIHAGSFLPAVANGLALGKKTDSAVVEMCKRFAKRGYVAVAPDHRLGWNPLSSNQDVRTGTILNAVYRAIQDVKNCVRYFRNDAATSNTYKIDVSKICVGGFGSGGYVAYAYGSLNKTAEIQLTKFIDFSQSPPAPYVNQALSGNFDGTDSTALNSPNYETYSSTVNVVFSLAGGMGDSSWVEAGEIPIISMHSYKDPFAPYTTGPVIVRATGQFVVEVSGGNHVTRRSQRLGNQAVFANSVFDDAYSTVASQNSPGMHGLYSFKTPAPGPNLSCTGANANAQLEWSAPWDWWNEPVFIASYNAYCSCTNGSVVACMNKLENPNMSESKAKAYIDTIQGYLNPRIVCAMGLTGCNSVGLAELSNGSQLSIYPNPANSEINFELTNGKLISGIKLHDPTGRLVLGVENLNVSSYKLKRDQLSKGLYFTTIESGPGQVVTKKLLLE